MTGNSEIKVFADKLAEFGELAIYEYDLLQIGYSTGLGYGIVYIWLTSPRMDKWLDCISEKRQDGVVQYRHLSTHRVTHACQEHSVVEIPIDFFHPLHPSARQLMPVHPC